MYQNLRSSGQSRSSQGLHHITSPMLATRYMELRLAMCANVHRISRFWHSPGVQWSCGAGTGSRNGRIWFLSSPHGYNPFSAKTMISAPCKNKEPSCFTDTAIGSHVNEHVQTNSITRKLSLRISARRLLAPAVWHLLPAPGRGASLVRPFWELHLCWVSSCSYIRTWEPCRTQPPEMWIYFPLHIVPHVS